MKRKQLLYIFGIILCFVACKDVNEFDVVTIRETPQINVVADAKGVVLKEDGTPVQGAEIQVGNVFTSTNSRGEYEVRNATMAKGRGQIQISKNGFFKQISTASAQSGEMSYNKIILSERGQAQTFNTNNTETVNISGLNITFPSGSLKTNSGQVYSGDVNVFSKKISPNDDGFSNKMMADLVGKTKEFEKKVLLPALMMNLELETSSGVELNFDGEDGVILEFEVPSDLEDEMGEAIAWEYDTEDEFWLEEVECYPSSGSYQCTLGGTGPWACCIPIDGVEVTLNVVNSNNTAAKHVKVEYDDQNSYFVFGGYTNNRGTIIGTLPVSAEFDLSVEDLCENIVFTDVVGEFQEDITLPNANLTNTVEQFSINAEGSIEDCSSSLVTPSWVNMRYAGNEKNFKVDNLGNFDVDVFFNCIDFPDLEVTGYNYTDEQQSETVLHDYLSDVNVG
ncbi:MAG: carboxypeptidase-like regulatory domain-containing protein, partial [Saprospiraceae bacterium]